MLDFLLQKEAYLMRRLLLIAALLLPLIPSSAFASGSDPCDDIENAISASILMQTMTPAPLTMKEQPAPLFLFGLEGGGGETIQGCTSEQCDSCAAHGLTCDPRPNVCCCVK